jgi:hypothetical protein
MLCEIIFPPETEVRNRPREIPRPLDAEKTLSAIYADANSAVAY